MTQNLEISRSKAWRRKQARRVATRIAEVTTWLSATVAKRKAERPAPVAAAKPHQAGKLTLMQRRRQHWSLDSELHEENHFLAPVPGAALVVEEETPASGSTLAVA